METAELNRADSPPETLAITRVHEIPLVMLSESFSIPVNIATKATAILGIRGSGKTNTATCIAEGLLRARIQTIIIDPLDVWYGIKWTPDGEPSKLPIVIIGGHHADFEIEPDQGMVLAELLVRKRLSACVSISHMSKTNQRKFVADLLEHIYEMKSAVEFKSACCIMVDEASVFMPQRVPANIARLVGACEDIVRRGRSRGLGMVAIDQRAASVNKDILSQIEMLVAHQLVSPQDREALQTWVEANDVGGQGDEFMRTIASQAQGEALFWSPVWLKLFEKVKVKKRDTYDSSATPDVLDTTVELQKDGAFEETLADIAEILSGGGSHVESHSISAGEVVYLRERVKELERQIADSGRPAIDPRAVSMTTLASLRDAVAEPLHDLSRALASIERTLQSPAKIVEKALEENKIIDAGSLDMGDMAEAGKPEKKPVRERLLELLARLYPLGVRYVDRQTAADLIAVDKRSRNFSEVIAELVSQNYIERNDRDQLTITEAGRELLVGAPGDPVSLSDMQERLYGIFEPTKAAILQSVIEAHPEAVARAIVAEKIEVSPTSSSFTLHITALKRLGLIVYPEHGYLSAGDALFPEGLD